MDEEHSIRVEVAYARPDIQVIIPLEVPADCTLHEALQRSKIDQQFPELDLSSVDVGIFGKIARMDRVLRERDRIEIYRPLIADPKEIRRRRAAEGKTMKKGG